jgi:hypothetical protein
MTEALNWAVAGIAALGGVTILSIAMLKGWRDWIGLQRLALERRDGPAPAAGRIELADLRERVRKLEAIAAGVDY